ncbi:MULTISPECIES: hypothetical protein [unclassified Spiroplasma]|uniref:hypothetical protein n=1 Tax=unclassified Spiroplasma TaxID=2637901 RepID=UPI00313EE18B
MSKELLEILKLYATSKQENNFKEITQDSKENIISLFIELIKAYLNDLNSSTLREMITVDIAGFKHLDKKIGYDGYRISSLTNEKEYCEVKPVNLRINDSGNLNKKFNGSGNFTDFSWKKLARIEKDNIKMILSGFLDGKLLYIISFSYSESLFMEKLKQQLENKYPDGDKIGFWLRSANFSYLDYKDAESLELIYLNQNIDEYKFAFVNQFFELLKSL